MRKSVVRIVVLSVLSCLAMIARADNIVTISSTEGAPGEEVTVSISLQNTDVLSSLQVSIPLDENLTLVEGSGQKGSRCSSHSLTVGVKDGVLNVFVYSISMAAISGNSGEVASFRLKLGNQPSTVALTPTKTVLTNTAGEAAACSSQGGEVTTRCAKAQYSTKEVDFGAVPIRSTYTRTVTVTNVGNADLTITDLIFSDINVFSSTTTLPLTVSAGGSKEVNITYAPEERGSITRTLKVECNSTSKLNTITLKAQPFAVNELHVQDASGISDEEVTVRMTMNNMDAISGYQVEFDLPDQLEYVSGSFAQSSRKTDHTEVVSYDNKKLRILVYSGSGATLMGEDGEIGSFRLKLVGRYGTTLTPSKTVLSATINNKVENVCSAVYGATITINSPQISCNSTLEFGAVPVTQACEMTYTISNYGSAPLTVSRIVFDNEQLSIKESLPLEVPESDSRTVTVVYGSTEQTAFSSTMHIYSNDPDLRLRDVAVSGSRFAPNYLTVSTSNVEQDGNLSIDVALDNYDDVCGLQFEVVYPHEYYETFANNYSVTARATGMIVTTTKKQDDNTLMVFCYFMSRNSIAAGKGKIMTLQLKPIGESVPLGSYNVQLRNIKLSVGQDENQANKYSGSETIQSSFEVKEHVIMKGDANDSGDITPQDASLVMQHYVGKIQLSADVLEAVDVNGDNMITPQDASLIMQRYVNEIEW